MKHHPEIVGRDVQCRADFVARQVVHLAQQEHARHTLGQLAAASVEDPPELLLVQRRAGPGPLSRRDGRVPVVGKCGVVERLSFLLAVELQVREHRLAARLAVVVEDLVLQDAGEPAALR